MTDTAAQVIAEGLEEMLDDHDWLPAAETVLAALAAAGYEVIRLPEPDAEGRFLETKRGRDDVWIREWPGEGMQVAHGREMAHNLYSPEYARALAPALLAAARHAEAGL